MCAKTVSRSGTTERILILWGRENNDTKKRGVKMETVKKIGVIEQRNRKSLFIATRMSSILDFFTLGFYPKPKYEQIGVFKGDTRGFKKGDRIKVQIKKKESLLDYILMRPNIIKVERL